MDAAQALADLTQVSSQIEGAVLAEADGTVLASTFADGRGKRVAEAALELLGAAEEARGEPVRAELSQVLATAPEGAVFLVRQGRHVVAAITGPQPTSGLVFYDLKTCLRLLADASAPKGKGNANAETRTPSEASDAAESGDA
jgi:predicted regulator of Ras-like GTPase activity (Roadblock/LC7/MglB family)